MGIEFPFDIVYIKTKIMTTTHAQARALEVITQELDKVAPGRGKDYMDVILGVLNIEMPVLTECVSTPVTGIGIDTPIGNEELQTHITSDPIYPHTPFPPQVWYNQEPEPEPIKTEVSCTGDKNGIVYTTNTADIRYNGDFRDVQTSFNDK